MDNLEIEMAISLLYQLGEALPVNIFEKSFFFFFISVVGVDLGNQISV